MVSTSPARRIPVILAAATLLWAASGCSSSPKADNQSAEPATGSIAASDVYRPPPWEKVYREGKRTIRREARQIGDSPSKWIIEEFQSVDEKLKGGLVRQTYIEKGPDGSIFLSELHLTLENKVLTFDPAIVLMPATLSADKSCVSESDVVLRESEDPDARKSRGHAIQTTRLVSQKGDASVISSDLSAKLDYTTIDRNVEMEVIPGRGIVREVQDRTVKFGLLNLSRTTSSAVLVEEKPK
ncbi:MAG: hypothetical protein U0573_04255 [Phycisphaerales bacterium]|nr:hypothetical protein [Planctomycetota bacterium]